MITIHNLKLEKMSAPFDFPIDRKTVVGNPFSMETEADREKVCEKYKEHFKKRMKESKKFRMYLIKLLSCHEKHGQLRLFCWCAPKQCHGETIKKYLERRLEQSMKYVYQY